MTCGRPSDDAKSGEGLSEASTPRVIGAFAGFAIVAGSMLGIGIFLAPPIVAAHVGSTWAFLAIWLLGGITALAGAVACAELGTLMPRAGGDYVFQYEAFGPSVAFASGWVLFAAIFCGSIAAMAVGLCQYQLPVITGRDFSTVWLSLPGTGDVTGGQLAAVAVVLVLTGVNALGAQPAARVQTIVTMLPIVLLTVLASYAIIVGGAGAPATMDARSAVSTDLNGLVTAYIAVYFAYAGWFNIVYVAGEVREPARNIPRALILGTIVVTGLYLLLCLGFVRVLGLEGVRAAGEVGTATAAVIIGEVGRYIVAVLIATALLGAINGSILGGARVAYAMALRRALWPKLGTIGSRGAPQRALWLQALIASVLIVSGKFEQLLSMVSLAMVLTGTLTVSAVFVLRRRWPHVPRPYRATLYPFLPCVYVVSSLIVIFVMTRRVVSGEPGAWFPFIGVVVLGIAFVGHLLVGRSGAHVSTTEQRG